MPLPKPSNEEDNHLPVVRLAVKLTRAASMNQKKGWHREELGLSDGKHLNRTKKNQILIEVMLLEQYIARWTPNVNPCQNLKGFQRDRQMKERMAQGRAVFEWWQSSQSYQQESASYWGYATWAIHCQIDSHCQSMPESERIKNGTGKSWVWVVAIISIIPWRISFLLRLW